MKLAIVNAHVVPVTAPSFDGSLILEDGLIAALGPDVAVPDGAEVVDAGGAWALPGFIEPHGHVGIDEEGHGWAGEDYNEGGEPVGPRFRALDGILPHDQGFSDALEGGVTAVVVMPGSANPIGGQTVALKAWGRMVDEMVIKAPCSMKSALGENPKNYNWNGAKQPPKTRMATAAMIRRAFRDAQDYGAARDAAAAEGKPFARNMDHEAMLQVLDGEIPWTQHCHRVDDITTAVRLADEFGYRLIINHGTESHLIADFLAARGIPCFIGPTFTTRRKLELINRTTRTPGILARAGVEFAMMTDHPVVPVNFLVYQTIVAVKEGLDRETALRAMTINPAHILGLDDRIGSLEPGKDADIVLWSGDPLEIMNRAERVFVDGREVYHFDHETGLGVTLDQFAALAAEDREAAR